MRFLFCGVAFAACAAALRFRRAMLGKDRPTRKRWHQSRRPAEWRIEARVGSLLALGWELVPESLSWSCIRLQYLYRCPSTQLSMSISRENLFRHSQSSADQFHMRVLFWKFFGDPADLQDLGSMIPLCPQAPSHDPGSKPARFPTFVGVVRLVELSHPHAIASSCSIGERNADVEFLPGAGTLNWQSQS